MNKFYKGKKLYAEKVRFQINNDIVLHIFDKDSNYIGSIHKEKNAFVFLTEDFQHMEKQGLMDIVVTMGLLEDGKR